MSRRYSQDEAQRVFARAARRPHAAPSPDGLTAEDLAEIGREGGLDPALVPAEAALETGDTPETTWHGLPATYKRSRLIPGRVSDAEWGRVVDVLRDAFGVAGMVERVGERREWATRDTATAAATRVGVGPADGGGHAVHITSSAPTHTVGSHGCPPG